MKQSESQPEPSDRGWRLVKPRDCAIAFGIPVSMEDFQKNSGQGFARQFSNHTGRIERFLYDYEYTSAVMKGSEASVITNVTLEKFGKLFTRHQVVILFSRAENGTVEFHEGLLEIDKIGEQIPKSFGGIVDITMCFSRELSRALRRNRPRCFPFYAADERLDARAWLFFYKALFMYLKSSELSYPEASRDVVRGFLNKVRRVSAE